MMTASLFQRATPLLFVLLWSTGFIGAKFGLPYAEPLTFLSTRYVLVIALMTLLALAMRAPWPASPRWMDMNTPPRYSACTSSPVTPMWKASRGLAGQGARIASASSVISAITST
jgi:drug/metabolite transporter (DMT)-like permease